MANAQLPPGAEDVMEFALRNPDLFRLISKEVDERSSRTAANRQSPDYVDLLKGLYAEFHERESFEPGALVQWKEGLKNRNRPDYGEPAIVVETLPEVVHPLKDDSGSAYFREPLDIKIGILNAENELIVYHFDSRRFTDYAPESRRPADAL